MPASRSTLSEPNSVSVTAFVKLHAEHSAILSQQSPFRLIDPRIRKALSKRWKLPLAYWPPRSEWKIRPGPGRRRNQAMRNASMTSRRVIRSDMAKPTLDGCPTASLLEDKLSAEQIDDHRQIQPAHLGPAIGDVAGPNLVRRLCVKVPLQEVRRHRQIMIAVSCYAELLACPSLESVFFHELTYTLLANAEAAGAQLPPYPWPATSAFSLGENGPDVHQESGVTQPLRPAVWGSLPPPPLMVAADAHTQNTTLKRYRPSQRVAFNEGVSHRDSFAKYAAAFLVPRRNPRVKK